MANKIRIYSLEQQGDLQNDLNAILARIGSMYAVTFRGDETEFMPKTMANGGDHWTSDPVRASFNRLVPEVKGLTRDMYSMIEVFYKISMRPFDKALLENKYSNFKEFRLLNNKFKHHSVGEVRIELTELVHIQGTQNLIDVFLNFHYADSMVCIPFFLIVQCFIKIMEDGGFIKINRSEIGIDGKIK